MNPEPSPAVTRLKVQARSNQQLGRGFLSSQTPQDLQAMQACERVEDSPDRETGSSPRLGISSSPAEEATPAQQPSSDGDKQRHSAPLTGLRVRTIVARKPGADMPPPRRIVRPSLLQERHSQQGRSQKSSQPGQDGFFSLRTRSRAPTQVKRSPSVCKLLAVSKIL